MSDSKRMMSAYTNANNIHHLDHQEELQDRLLENLQPPQTHPEPPLTSLKQKSVLSPIACHPSSRSEPSLLRDMRSLDVESIQATERRVGWKDLPIEVQLKILESLNETTKLECFRSKNKPAHIYHHSRASPYHRSILKSGHLAPLALVSRGFEELVQSFVWEALDLRMANLQDLMGIQSRLIESPHLCRSVRSLSLAWYQPQFNNIWQHWQEDSIYSSCLSILESITHLQSLDLSLSDSPPEYDCKPLSEIVRWIGQERTMGLQSFRVRTTWRLHQAEEELILCMINKSKRLKVFECHSGRKAMALQYDRLMPPHEKMGSRGGLGRERERASMADLLSSMFELQSLSISCEGCLNEDWNSVKWNSIIHHLSLSDFSYDNWKIGFKFIHQFSNSLSKLELISDNGMLSGSWNAIDYFSLPILKSLRLRMRSEERLGACYFHFLGLFSKCDQITNFELIEDVQASQGLIQSASLIHGLQQWTNLRSVKLILKRTSKQIICQSELKSLDQFLNQKEISFQFHVIYQSN